MKAEFGVLISEKYSADGKNSFMVNEIITYYEDVLKISCEKLRMYNINND